jgi:hypothetical protein
MSPNSSIILIFYVTSKNNNHKINRKPSPKQDRVKNPVIEIKMLMVISRPGDIIAAPL